MSANYISGLDFHIFNTLWFFIFFHVQNIDGLHTYV
jgi:hypothetical protein